MNSISVALICTEFVATIGVFVYSIFSLPDRICPGLESFSVAAFKARHPQYDGLLAAHRFISWLVLFGCLGGAVMLLNALNPPLGLSYGVLAFWFSLLMIGNGAFEVATAISPKYGFVLRRWHNQMLRLGPPVRVLGVVRMLLGGAYLGLAVVAVFGLR
jgi:hypothetical protein